MKVLLTGFGPFGSVVDNPTARLAAHFDGKRFAEREIVGLQLPTSFSRAPAMIAERLSREAFDAVLMLGVAASAHAIRVEQFARRVTRVRGTDVDGALAEALDGPEVLPVTIDAEQMVAALEPFDAELSDDAGAYVCNHTLYATLARVRGVRVGFVHLPPDERTLVEVPANAFRSETLMRAVELSLSVV